MCIPMGQGEVFQFLQENEGKIFTCKDISMALDITSTGSLSRLRKYPPKGFKFSKNGTSYTYWFISTH